MRRPHGFTLVEIVVVLLIFGVVIAMGAAITRAVTAGQKRSITTARLAAVDVALAQFVAVQKRLPCPADGTKPSTDNNVGIETAHDGTGCTAQQNGVVPWRALGLSEQDATDGWNRRLTYRVPGTLGADNGMDMSKCDPAGSEAVSPAAACNSACASTALSSCTPPRNFLVAKGFTVRTSSIAPVVTVMNPAGDPPTGAAYVVISHGESGGGGFTGAGVIAPSTVTDGDEEKKNYADLVLQPYYVDDTLVESSGGSHFDDVVSRPSILAVVNKAGLGPRTH
jgi:prepilin-type N-terminal cleavage/methylation domain-containing protein